jgi:SAM-dependent methyltransferase
MSAANDMDKIWMGLPYRDEEPARTPEEVKRRHESNRFAWNEAAARYTEGVKETIAFLQARKSNLHPIERKNLARFSPLQNGARGLLDWCSCAVHLQCASGRDTLSLWVEGARRVVGIDISDAHIANAQQTSTALKAPAQWHRCDVLDTPHTLDGSADLVYTGRGAMCWLHDLDGWAAVIFRLLKPGGIFSLLDDHPFTWLFDTSAETLVPSGVDYFSYAEASKGWGSNYIGDLAIPVEKQSVKHERLWTLGMIFQSLRNAGLEILFLGEHPEPYWDVFPNLKPEFKGKVPLTFSIIARK